MRCIRGKQGYDNHGEWVTRLGVLFGQGVAIVRRERILSNPFEQIDQKTPSPTSTSTLLSRLNRASCFSVILLG
jgi:hypothetical protein